MCEQAEPRLLPTTLCVSSCPAHHNAWSCQACVSIQAACACVQRVSPVLLCSEKQKLIDSMIAIDRGVSRRQLNGITRRVQRFYRDRRNRLLMKETLQRAGLDYNLLSGEYSNRLLAGASTVFGLEEDVAILLIQAALRGFLARGVCKRLRFVRTGVQFVALLVEYETALDSLHYDPTQNVSSHP